MLYSITQWTAADERERGGGGGGGRGAVVRECCVVERRSLCALVLCKGNCGFVPLPGYACFPLPTKEKIHTMYIRRTHVRKYLQQNITMISRNAAVGNNNSQLRCKALLPTFSVLTTSLPTVLYTYTSMRALNAANQLSKLVK